MRTVKLNVLSMTCLAGMSCHSALAQGAMQQDRPAAGQTSPQSPAQGQPADPGGPAQADVPGRTANMPPISQVAVEASNDATGSGDIIVTARKRSESVQSVPQTIQVIGEAQLAISGGASLVDLAAVAPGLNIQEAPNPGNFAVTLRGLGSQPGNPSFDSSVSLFVDGVFSGRSREFDAATFDVERIEVIRGTQTALLGKNTSLGALNLVTRKPGHDFGFDLRVQQDVVLGGTLVEGGVDVPVNEKLQFRVSGQYHHVDGPIRNTITGQTGLNEDRGAVRIVGVWKPTDRLDVTALYQHANVDSNGPNSEFVAATPAAFGLAALAGAANVFEANLNYRSAVNHTRSPGGVTDEIRADRGSVTANWLLGDHTLTSQTGYTASRDNSTLDADFLPGDYFVQIVRDSSKQFTQELRLASPAGGRLEYLVGGLFLDGRYKNQTQQDANYPFGPAPGAPNFTGAETTYFDQKDTAYSAFGQANLKLVGRLKLTAGVRYTNEKKSVDLARLIDRPGLYSIAVQPPFAPFSLSEREQSVDGSVGLNWQLDRNVLLYASWGQGTKAGGFAQSATNLRQSRIFPEVAQTTEAGFKSQFANRKITVNAAFFYTVVDGYQLVTFNGVSFDVGNTNLRSVGVESELVWQPNRDVRLYSNNTYAHSVDTRIGGDIPFAPRFNGSVGASFGRDVFTSKRVSLDANLDYRSSETSQQNVAVAPRLPALTQLNASIGFGDPAKGWEFRVIGRNLNDQRILGFDFPVPLLPPGNVAGLPLRPRTVLLQFTIKH